MPQVNDSLWTTALWFFIIPATVGIGASLIANFLYPILLSQLESRKVISLQKRKKSAEALHRIITHLHEGTYDKVEFFVRMYGVVFSLFSIGITSLIGGMVVIALLPLPGGNPQEIVKGPILVTFLMLMGLVSLTLQRRFLGRIKSVRSALRDFDAYMREYKQQWTPPASLA